MGHPVCIQYGVYFDQLCVLIDNQGKADVRRSVRVYGNSYPCHLWSIILTQLEEIRFVESVSDLCCLLIPFCLLQAVPPHNYRSLHNMTYSAVSSISDHTIKSKKGRPKKGKRIKVSGVNVFCLNNK